MDEFSSLSHDLVSSQPPQEEATIALAERLQNANDLWGSLKDGADERKRALDNALDKAGEFEDAMQPVLEWLEEKEAEVKGWEPVALEPGALEQQLADNEVCSDRQLLVQ